MAYGIGSVIGDIDQKVDTYRNNPEALAQMYQQNQQLIDLLALQKLKTEKEAAMRDMQMKMQTPAASIKDQREQEVMGMMRNEVAQQVAPGLQVAGQQAAQAAAPPVPQGGGLQSLPAPNMQGMGMAEGGIVAFAGERGSYVSQEAYRRQKAKERAEKERRANAASAAELEAVYGEMASAQGTAALPYSSESILQDLMSRANRPASGQDDAAPVDPGPGSVGPRMSQEALRKFDERRAAEAQDSSGIGDAIKDQWTKSQTRELLTDPKAQWERSKTKEVADYLARVPGAVSETASQATSGLGSLLNRAGSAIAESEGRTVPESPAPRTPSPAVVGERVTPATKGPEMTVPAAVQTVKDYVSNASITPPTELEELQYRNALRVLGTAGISTDDLFRGGKGFFDQDSGVLGMGEEGLQEEVATLTRQLQTVQAYKEYGVPPPESYPSEEAIMRRLKVVNAFLAPAAPQAAPQAAPPPAPPPVTQAVTQADPPTTTPDATAGISTLPKNQTPLTMPTPDDPDALMNLSYKAVKQAPPEVQNEYTRRLSELRGEQESKLEALIAFLQGAGGKTSFAATMSGGAAGMNAREQQIENEIMATVDKIEGLKLKEREMGVEEDKVNAMREGNRLQAEASRYNADIDYAAAMAQVDADNYNTLADYRAAMAEKAASSAKAINDAIEKQQLTTAQRLELFASFDENLAADVRDALIEQLEDTETPPDSPEGQQTIQDGITAERNAFVLKRINEVRQSYPATPGYTVLGVKQPQ